MELGLRDKVVCVTGGSRGIGLATARSFAAEGAQVVICGRDQPRLDAAVARIKTETGCTVDAVSTDVTDRASIDALMAHIAQRYARLDVLVNNAGTGTYKAFAEVTDDELMAGMAINFFAQFRVTQAALPLLRAGTQVSVINVSGRTALRGNFPPGSSCTGPSKAAEIRFSIDLSTELAELGIRVNCVVPGVVESEDRFKLWEDAAMNGDVVESQAEHLRRKVEKTAMAAGRRWGQPEQVADVIAFLASDRALYVNGAALTIDGGPHNKSYVTELYTQRQALRQDLDQAAGVAG